MSAFVYHITILCNNIPLILRKCMPKSKVDAIDPVLILIWFLCHYVVTIWA